MNKWKKWKQYAHVYSCLLYTSFPERDVKILQSLFMQAIIFFLTILLFLELFRATVSQLLYSIFVSHETSSPVYVDGNRYGLANKNDTVSGMKAKDIGLYDTQNIAEYVI